MIIDIKQVQQAESAVVFLAAAWSHVAVAGQRQFEDFAAKVASIACGGRASFAVLEEEEEAEETL